MKFVPMCVLLHVLSVLIHCFCLLHVLIGILFLYEQTVKQSYEDVENGPTAHFYMPYEAEEIKVSAQCNKKTKWHISEDSKPHQVGIKFIFACVCVCVCVFSNVRCTIMDMLIELSYSLW